MNSKRMEFKIATEWGRTITISVDLDNGSRVTVEGAEQVVGIYPVKVDRPWATKDQVFDDRVVVMAEQKGANDSVITAEIFSERAQNWGAFNRPKLIAYCQEGEFVKGLKPRIEVSVTGNLLSEGEKSQKVGFSEVAQS